MISDEALARFARGSSRDGSSGSEQARFDIDCYLAKHRFEVIRRKPWNSHPGGQVLELARCPFNPDHVDGSAALTMIDSRLGFDCKHNSCHGKTIKDVLALYPAEDAELNKSEVSKPDESRTQVQILCDLAADAELFHTPDREPYARLRVAKHNETWPVRKSGFRQWLIRQFYNLLGKPPGCQALQDAIALLEAKALFDSPECPVYIRIGESDGVLYIDLANAEWEVVEITATGWRVTATPRIRFKRTPGMRALPRPAEGGSLTLLRDLINIGDDDNWSLCVSWLVAALRPRGPYPILILQGEQGSAKSTTAKLLRRVVDPSTAPVRTPPRDERDLIITASNSWMLTYDNVSGIPPWLSDGLCRMATGGGFSTRKLYTDSDEVFFECARPISINGIDHVADRPDLADRALILNVPRIDELARREESELYADFETKLPQILGALYDGVSTALRRFHGIVLPRKPRMADFAAWAVAAAPAFGFAPEVLLNAYSGNRSEAVQETLDGDPVATAIVTLFEKTQAPSWDGNCKALLEELAPYVQDSFKRSHVWPKTPRGLSGRLRRLMTFLREGGISITFHDKAGKGSRPLTITRTPVHLTATSASSATPTVNDSNGQQNTGQVLGGGLMPGVALESKLPTEPPPTHTARKLLNGRDKQIGEAVAAEVAVVCSPVLTTNRHKETRSHRTDLCSRCGETQWKWVNRKWVCPQCGQPAGQEAIGPTTDTERFVV